MTLLLKFWLAKYIVGFGIAVLVVLVTALAGVPQLIRQRRCKHEHIREDRARTAWCQDCGANLGFIGNWRL